MRISDWSSDVCSSDLPDPIAEPRHRGTEGDQPQWIDDDHGDLRSLRHALCDDLAHRPDPGVRGADRPRSRAQALSRHRPGPRASAGVPGFVPTRYRCAAAYSRPDAPPRLAGVDPNAYRPRHGGRGVNPHTTGNT